MENKKYKIKGLRTILLEDNDTERIIKSTQVRDDIFDKHNQGLAPYIFDSAIDGNYRMVEVTKQNIKKVVNTNHDIFLLKMSELEKINILIDNVNELTRLTLEQIRLRKQLILGVLIEKIMK